MRAFYQYHKGVSMLLMTGRMGLGGDVSFSVGSDPNEDQQNGLAITVELAHYGTAKKASLAEQQQKGLEYLVQALEREHMTWLTPGLRVCTVDLDALKERIPQWVELKQATWLSGKV